jgi:AcrR family transcriptional regulator
VGEGRPKLSDRQSVYNWQMVDGRKARGRQTRDRLVAAARELFGEHGYDQTSVRDVLDASGVARGALYHHFQSKSDLFEAVAEAVFAEVASSTNEAASGGATPLERLRAGAHAWLEMARDPAIQRIVLLDSPTVLGWPRWRALDERHSLGDLQASLRRLAREGRLPSGQEEIVARMLLAALNEAALFIGCSPDEARALEEACAAADLLIDRLAGAAAGGRPRGSADAGANAAV